MLELYGVLMTATAREVIVCGIQMCGSCVPSETYGDEFPLNFKKKKKLIKLFMTFATFDCFLLFDFFFLPTVLISA